MTARARPGATAPTRWRSLGRRPRDPLGVGLVIYGLTGLLLLAATLALMLASLGTVEQMAETLRDDGPDSVGARLDAATAALVETQAALESFEATLVATSGAAGSGEQLGRQLAASLRQLAVALDVTVLGTRPFAGLGAEFNTVAANADALAADLALTADALDGNQEALDRLGTELARLRGELVALRTGFAGPLPGDQPDGVGAEVETGLLPAAEAFTLSRLVMIAMLLWLGIQAVLALALGLRRVRRAPATATLPIELGRAPRPNQAAGTDASGSQDAPRMRDRPGEFG
jgi:hypothetical protein